MTRLVLLGFFCVVCIAPPALPAEAQRRNVLFLIVGDLMATLGCYGDPAACTPHMDDHGSDQDELTNLADRPVQVDRITMMRKRLAIHLRTVTAPSPEPATKK